MAGRRLSDDEVEQVAQRAAQIVLASDELRDQVRAVARSERRRPSDAAAIAARSSERAARRQQGAEARQAEREAEEQQRAQQLVALWLDGVPRPEITERLGFTKPGFEAEVQRLRREGEDRLKYRPGID